jgi:glycosyltransferase involved in cell wall biosynthesis
MHIGILGTRGIPNHYGGFEQFAQYLALGLVKKGIEVTVYNSSNHPYKGSKWNNANIVHCYDPEKLIGTTGQFIYDLNCIWDARKRNFDIILQLGYTSNSVWGWLLPSKAIITTNMDGLEWKRTKYSKKVQKFLAYAESLAVKYSPNLIADSIGIQEYLLTKYNRKSLYIPYGADLFNSPDESVLSKYAIEKYQYNLLIARLEPENSIDDILSGVAKSGRKDTFLVIGKNDSVYGQYLKKKFAAFNYIRFIDGIFDINVLNNLRHFSNLYFHGHTVGGTNPSLLEAMASDSLICANNNIFNNHILGEDAYYFNSDTDVSHIINNYAKIDSRSQQLLNNNREKIKETYSWDRIINQYCEHFESILKRQPEEAVLDSM